MLERTERTERRSERAIECTIENTACDLLYDRESGCSNVCSKVIYSVLTVDSTVKISGLFPERLRA